MILISLLHFFVTDPAHQYSEKNVAGSKKVFVDEITILSDACISCGSERPIHRPLQIEKGQRAGSYFFKVNEIPSDSGHGVTGQGLAQIFEGVFFRLSRRPFSRSENLIQATSPTVLLPSSVKLDRQVGMHSANREGRSIVALIPETTFGPFHRKEHVFKDSPPIFVAGGSWDPINLLPKTKTELYHIMGQLSETNQISCEKREDDAGENRKQIIADELRSEDITGTLVEFLKHGAAFSQARCPKTIAEVAS